jgi:hypothetical protein
MRLLPEPMVEASNDAFISFACYLGFYNLWRVSKRFDKDENSGRCWFIFSIGLLFDAVGHTVYAVQEFAYGEAMSFPNIADVLIITGQISYITSLAFFLNEINHLQLFPTSKRKVIGNTVVLFLAASIIYFIIYPVMIDDSEPLYMRCLYQIYPVMDIFLSWYAIHLLLAFTVMGFSPISKPWVVIVMGFMLFFITDSTYAYYEVIGNYHPYLLINPGWGLSYLLLSYASTLQIKLMDQLRPVSE